MKSHAILFGSLLSLSACDEQKPAPAPVATPSPLVTPVIRPMLPALGTPLTTINSAAVTWATIAPGAFTLDASHSQLGFGVKHMMVSTTRGEFRKFSGTAFLDTSDLSKANVTLDIDADSIDTREAKRDQHLKSKDFFETDKFKKITFKSTKIEKVPTGYAITGDLTIRDVTKSVTLDFEPFTAEVKDPWGGQRTGTRGHGKIKRSDFGLKFNATLETGGAVVGDEVALDLEGEFVRTPEGAAGTKK